MNDRGSEEFKNPFKRARRVHHAPNSGTDRLPPHSTEAEMGVLGCILLSPNECLGECIEKLRVGAEAFYDLRHQTIFSMIVEMFDHREAVDIITLQQKLKDKQLLEQVGGIAYLASMPEAVPSAANLSYYLDIIQEKFQLRRMIHTCTDCVSKVYDFEGEVEELLDELERDVLQIRIKDRNDGIKPIKNLVVEAIGQLEKLHEAKGVITGMTTGFSDLDRMTGGFNGGEMITIAARPSMGKTSLGMNIAEYVATTLKLPVGVFSLEMSSESLVLRMLCSRARVNLRNVRDGFMSQRDFPKLTVASGALSTCPLHIDDTSGLTIMQLRARARTMHQQRGIKLFVIDYLQLLRSDNTRNENRQQEIADISNGIKSLAKELNVPVIVMSQLNREIEKDKRRKPRLSDLRESGAIEQDSDLVGILYNPGETEVEKETESDCVPINLLVAKQRNGPTGDIPLTFLKGYTRFESAAKVSEEDVSTQDSQRYPND